MKLSKRKLKYAAGAVIVLMLSVITLYYLFKPKPAYYIDDNHYLHYPSQRGQVASSILATNETENFTEQKITFQSKDLSIFGLLFVPKNAVNLPAIIILPGGGVKKEDEARIAKFAVNRGFVAFTYDQRGIGETGGLFAPLDYDFKSYMEGKEPVQHLAVYDALRAVDLVRQLPYVNKQKVILAGESMGGRFSIIAAAIDPSISAEIVISSSGYGTPKAGDESQQRFIDSINPDHYISLISPRPVFFLHGQNDTTVPLQNAQYTYSLASQPKKFYYTENCGHGLCDRALPAFEDVLEILRNS